MTDTTRSRRASRSKDAPDAPPAGQPTDKANAAPAPAVPSSVTLLTEDDLYLFNEGNHFRLYEKMGAHLLTIDGVAGAYFAVWAPNADYVAVIGDFNGWDRGAHPLTARGNPAEA